MGGFLKSLLTYTNELEVKLDFSDVDPNLLKDNEEIVSSINEITNNSELENSLSSNSKLETKVKDKASRFFKKST